MYILYLDDAGSPPNLNEKHFVLGGFCVFERQVYWLAKKLDDLAADIDPVSPSSIEFHASEIFSGRIPPWKDMDKPKRINVIKSVSRILAEAHESTKLFACVVHKPSFPNQDPVEIAFENLCNRLELFLKRKHSLEGSNQRGLIILDKSTMETTLQSLAVNFRSIGTRWGIMKKLAEVPLFVDSRATRLIQLADHVAYAVFRRYEAQDANYLDPILFKFDAEEGKIHGLIHLPRSFEGCLCPACMSRNLSR